MTARFTSSSIDHLTFELSDGTNKRSVFAVERNASRQEFAHVDDEVVSCGDNDDGGEGSGEVVRVVCDRFILSLREGAKS